MDKSTIREFQGHLIAKVRVVQPNYAVPEGAILDAEAYLNGDVSAELYARYGVSIRVHMQG